MSNAGYCDDGFGGRGGSSSSEEAKTSFDDDPATKRLRSGVDLLAVKVGLKVIVCTESSVLELDCNTGLLDFFFSTCCVPGDGLTL